MNDIRAIRATAVRRGFGHRSRTGFTLVEMMMAVLLTMLVFAITVPFFRVQTLAVDTGAGRLDALQNARFAQNAIDRELRIAGGVTGQPIIVQAAPFSVTFNVDLVSRLSSDADATYYNPTADSLATESWAPSRKKSLPTASKQYPTSYYYDAAGNQSNAETISYFLYRDTTGGRTDLYTLYRRVNDRDSTLITRSMWIPADTNYFFRYYKADNTGALSLIPSSSLPLYWDAASHLQDSVAMVEMRVAGLYRDVRRATDVTRTIYHRAKLQNYGKLMANICGDPPSAPPTVSAVQVLDAFGAVEKITVTWSASLSESAGEADVQMYVVLRRPNSGTDWAPLQNISARGLSTYTFDDQAFSSGAWVYGVYAQDCSPANSPTTAAGTPVVNP